MLCEGIHLGQRPTHHSLAGTGTWRIPPRTTQPVQLLPTSKQEGKGYPASPSDGLSHTAPVSSRNLPLVRDADTALNVTATLQPLRCCPPTRVPGCGAHLLTTAPLLEPGATAVLSWQPPHLPQHSATSHWVSGSTSLCPMPCSNHRDFFKGRYSLFSFPNLFLKTA